MNSKDREPSRAFATTMGGVVFAAALWFFLGTRPWRSDRHLDHQRWAGGLKLGMIAA